MTTSNEVLSKRSQVKKTASATSQLLSERSNNNTSSSSQTGIGINLRSPVQAVMVAIGLCGMASAIFSILHVHHTIQFDDGASALQMSNGVPMVLSDFKHKPKTQKQTTTTTAVHNDRDESPHYHTLQCQEYGGPSEEAAQELVYWQG